MTELPLAPLKRILKNAGATRISDEAVEELAKVLEQLGKMSAVKQLNMQNMQIEKLLRQTTLNL